jgi:nitrite reductase/ring-hydroxylating ferredoxin subunit
MSRLVPACHADDLEPGTVRRFDIEGTPIAIYNIDGTFYATDDRCTHGAASLAEGLLEGDTIECDLHFGAFHVPTGKPVAPPCAVPVKTFPVVLQDGTVLVDLDAS